MLGPNITGETTQAFRPTTQASGAFCNGAQKTYSNDGTVANNYVSNVFDASKSNSIYSTSDTVQPSASQVLIIIKT